MKGQSRKGFTLIELLVVIAIIAILAAILFPVFAKAREKARQTSCLNNLKQIALASIQYTQDYDEYFYPHRWKNGQNPDSFNAGTPGNGIVNGDANVRTFWPQLIMPYIKANGVFVCPSNPNGWTIFDPKNPAVPCGGGTSSTKYNGCDGVGYGWENSYGHNDMWMSPAAANGGASGLQLITQANIARPSRTILCADSTYYGLAPDGGNTSGGENYDGQSAATALCVSAAGDCASGDQTWMIDQDTANQTSVATCYYCNYWHNLGNSTYDWSTNATQTTPPYAPDNTTAQTMIDIQGRHTSFINCAFTDGHVKALTSTEAAFNMCNWVIDANIVDPGGSNRNIDHSKVCSGR